MLVSDIISEVLEFHGNDAIVTVINAKDHERQYLKRNLEPYPNECKSERIRKLIIR